MKQKAASINTSKDNTLLPSGIKSCEISSTSAMQNDSSLQLNRPKRGRRWKLTNIMEFVAIFTVAVQCCTMYFFSIRSKDNDISLLDTVRRGEEIPDDAFGQNSTTVRRFYSNLTNHHKQSSPDIVHKKVDESPKITFGQNSTFLRDLSNLDDHHIQSKCPTDLKSTSLATTLVTQTTLDRLPLLKETCQRWSSPIITVVYLTPHEIKKSWQKVLQTYSEICAHMTLIPYQAKDNMEERRNAYPINKMRNVGLDEVKTSHILLIDADFIPSVGLDDGVQKAVQAARAIRMNKETDKTDKTEEAEGSRSIRGDHDDRPFALVVPAYERTLDSSPCEDLEGCLQLTAQNPEFMPRSMESLSKCVNTVDTNADKESLYPFECIVFHIHYFRRGHRDTKSDEWLKKMDRENIRSIPCIGNMYEPYVVLPWCPSEHYNHGTKVKETRIEINTPLSPYYDERFYGYGQNKIQQIHHLRARGYEFAVIPALGFLTHHPHPYSKTKLKWKSSIRQGKTGLRQKMEFLYDKYQLELKSKYEGKVKEATSFCVEEGER